MGDFLPPEVPMGDATLRTALERPENLDSMIAHNSSRASAPPFPVAGQEGEGAA